MQGKVTYREAADDDLDWTYRIKELSLRPHIEKIWGWDGDFQIDYHRRNFVPANTRIVINDGVEVGFYVVSGNPERVFIENILLDPASQGKGIGTTVLTDIIKKASISHQEIELQVFKINSKAKALYDRLGFSTFETTDLHYKMRYGLQLMPITEENFFLVHQLRDEAVREGCVFVEKTIADWESGENRFSGPGEKLWGLVSGNELVGIGGLNRDPFTDDPHTGRVRHLYIRPSNRRKACATVLMQAIMGQARQHFRMLRLFTANPAAAVFYERLGFQPADGHKASHFMEL